MAKSKNWGACPRTGAPRAPAHGILIVAIGNYSTKFENSRRAKIIGAQTANIGECVSCFNTHGFAFEEYPFEQQAEKTNSPRQVAREASGQRGPIQNPASDAVVAGPGSISRIAAIISNGKRFSEWGGGGLACPQRRLPPRRHGRRRATW